MDIVRNADGTLVVPVAPERQHTADGEEGAAPTPRRTTGRPPACSCIRAREATTRRWRSGTSSRTPIASRWCRRPADGGPP